MSCWAKTTESQENPATLFCRMERQTHRDAPEHVEKQMKILNRGSDGFLILKRPELIWEVWRFAAKFLMEGRPVAASPEGWKRASVL